MANKNGHWYTDKNGNHYFVEEGQTPQEGWEASKRRKMINGGKYQVSEDGNEYRDVEKDEYDKFEADDASFDDNIDDDFGFDEEMEVSDEEKQEFIDQLVKDNYFQEGEIKDIKFNDDDDATIDITTDKGTKRYEYVGGRLFDHEGSNEDDEYNREMAKAQEQNAAMSEGQDAPNNFKEYTDKNGEKVKEFSSDKDAKKWFDEHQNELPDGTVLYSNKVYMGKDDNFNKGQTVDAPEKGEGWKKTKMASGTLYEGPNGERYMDDGAKPQFSREQREATYRAEDEVGLADYKYKTKEDVDKVANWLVNNHYAKDNSEAIELIKSEMRDPSEIDRALEKSPYKSKYDPEDFEDARFYPSKSTMDENNRWVGRYHSMTDAHGLKGWNDENVKHVGNYNGTDMVQLPDGYYSINPNITSMSFKTKEALENYLSNKNPEEHKYGAYYDEKGNQKIYRGKGDDGKEYDMEGPDAYKAARKNKPTGTQGNQEKISRVKNLVDKGILSKEDWTRFMNGSLSDEELIKKILG